MAGKKVAGIITYDIDSLGYLSVDRELIYPQLRRHLEDGESKWQVYRSYLKGYYDDDLLPTIYCNNIKMNPTAVSKVTIDGTLEITHHPSSKEIVLKRDFFPSVDQRMFVEQWTITNTRDSIADIQITPVSQSLSQLGPKGPSELLVESVPKSDFSLSPNESYTFDIIYGARKRGDDLFELQLLHEERQAFLDDIHENLKLNTPDSVLNTLFAFSKVRATESIFDSKMGLVHSPGGGRYYTGIWANDQAEYSGPFFPYLGLEQGNIAALNTYKRFWEMMQTIPNHEKNIWASFEMNGEIPCCGSDRGDAAMVAFGGLHYLLATGDLELCRQYEPMINWCLTWNAKKLNSEGVVRSDTDEMEGRIETGSANLSTSSLYYGALDLAIGYYGDLGYDLAKLNELRNKRDALGKAIEKYFGANIEGLDTYKYFKEHKYLRHWICMPLVVGLHDHVDATVTALFDRLWSENGVHVEKNSDNKAISKIFWDRGTLYALRGTIMAGEIEVSLQKLQEFSKKRLIGDRVPYVVEAYPEGNMAHLSAESALYCRVFIEGMFGIKPIGTNAFDLTPRLPQAWNAMSLDRIAAFGLLHNIKIERIGQSIQVTVSGVDSDFFLQKTIKDGATLRVQFD